MTRTHLLTQLDAIDTFTSRMRTGPDAAYLSAAYLSAANVLALFRAIGATQAVREAIELTDIEVAGGWPDVVAVEFRT